jgi:hypothetical protein
MNQAATDAQPRKRHDFRHPNDALYAAQQRPGFQTRNSGNLSPQALCTWGVERLRVSALQFFLSYFLLLTLR